MVMHDRWSKKIMARVIREEGVHDYAIDRVATEIRNLGYKRFILKSDQERSIKALEEKVKGKIKGH